MPIRIAYEEDFEDSPNYRGRQPAEQEAPRVSEEEAARLKGEAMRHMALAWHKLVRANGDAAATAAEVADSAEGLDGTPAA